ncbi:MULTISPECIES: tripartite tricarboxylate transporter substrate binding protein [unclassified Bradyrhizobium]|uniref:Bug family tripartite tricarboxylate transporter substrate binding protein n=1 Tax=unclassified Bradyrhizobium TaxID=2631580 RepID=UPI001FF49250|nr:MULTISPECIES: tripartite tricarboxylate transporter substrate binding protein [unclassified Bradyrhizobium]MCJ9700354.1 tripartite tricarboxylate transporter substrate binding protein [Bradyrhizobium sp. SHOUNA76]MCJ9729916.1 tripartite tricarboxylate transporter substrate binding protein [Bradyrhizobium sp. PRIMUS42]
MEFIGLCRKLLLASSIALSMPAIAWAEFPERSIKFIVPFAAGGPTDALARSLAEGVRTKLGQPVIVENRAGAGANVGADFVAKSPADGYTLLFGTSGPLAINVSLYTKLSYDPIKSFDPVIMIGKMPNVLSVHPSVPAQNVQELIAYAKANAGKLSFSSSGNGASTHLAGVMFNAIAGTDILHVPYRGGAPAINDLIGGQVQMSFADIFVSAPHIKAGVLRALGVTTIERTPVLPDVPTFDEQGLKGFDVSVFFGVVAPKGVPAPIVEKLNAAFVAAMNDSSIKPILDAQGIIPAPSNSPAYLANFMAREIPKWRDLINSIGLRIE